MEFDVVRSGVWFDFLSSFDFSLMALYICFSHSNKCVCTMRDVCTTQLLDRYGRRG